MLSREPLYNKLNFIQAPKSELKKNKNPRKVPWWLVAVYLIGALLADGIEVKLGTRWFASLLLEMNVI